MRIERNLRNVHNGADSLDLYLYVYEYAYESIYRSLNPYVSLLPAYFFFFFLPNFF